MGDSRSGGRLSAAAIDDLPLLVSLLGAEPERVIGPVFQGSVTLSSFRRPATRQELRMIESSDTLASALRTACGETEWEVSGLSKVSGPIAVAFDGDDPVAAAGLRYRDDKVAD